MLNVEKNVNGKPIVFPKKITKKAKAYKKKVTILYNIAKKWRFLRNRPGSRVKLYKQ